uniref:Uncharacterized protein n=1 Tax=Amphimedon queenslandica TaxID=400682 RepID=A0A1X7TCD0_AMPQE
MTISQIRGFFNSTFVKSVLIINENKANKNL